MSAADLPQPASPTAVPATTPATTPATPSTPATERVPPWPTFREIVEVDFRDNVSEVKRANLPDAARHAYEGSAYYTATLDYFRRKLELHLRDVPGVVVPNDRESAQFVWRTSAMSWRHSFLVEFHTGLPDGGRDDRWISAFTTMPGHNTVSIVPTDDATNPETGAPVKRFCVVIDYTPRAPDRSTRETPPNPTLTLPGRHVPTTAEILADPAGTSNVVAPAPAAPSRPAAPAKRPRPPAREPPTAAATPPPAKRARVSVEEEEEPLETLGSLSEGRSGMTGRSVRLAKTHNFAESLFTLADHHHHPQAADDPPVASPARRQIRGSVLVHMRTYAQAVQAAEDEARAANAEHRDAIVAGTRKPAVPKTVPPAALETLLATGYPCYVRHLLSKVEQGLADRAAAKRVPKPMRQVFTFVGHLLDAVPPKTAKGYAQFDPARPMSPAQKKRLTTTVPAEGATCAFSRRPLPAGSRALVVKLKPRAETAWYKACQKANGGARVGYQELLVAPGVRKQLHQLYQALFATVPTVPAAAAPSEAEVTAACTQLLDGAAFMHKLYRNFAKRLEGSK